MEFYAAERKKELLPFPTAWKELESVMLSEVSRAVKDKHHVISPVSGTHSTKQTSKQNRTRDIEIKNKPTVTGAGMGGDKGGKKGKGQQGTCTKDPWTWTRTTNRWRGLSVGGGGRWGEESNGDKMGPL